MKICTVCKIEKPYDSFHNSVKSKDGKGYRCIECDKNARKEYKERNRERFLKKSRATNLMLRFGMTEDDYYSMLSSQGGVCKICGASNPNGRDSSSDKMRHFSVDHCHITGKIRGLLCTCCNRGLGLLGDTVEDIRRALEYLELSIKE